MLALVLIAVLAPLGRAADTAKPAAATPATYRISGKVVNGSSDQPLADAEVSIYLTSNFSLIQTVASSDDGRFVFDSVPKGKYMLQGMRRGFLTAAYDEHDGFNTAIATGEGLASENLIFRLMPDAIISGVVLDENSEPVRQANLVLYMQDTREGIAKVSQVASTMTDDTGGYEFPHLHSGTYFLAANATPWYATHPSNIASAQNPAGPPPEHSPLDVVYPVSFYSDAADSDSATPIPVKGGDDLQINFALHPVPALHLLFHLPEQRADSGGGAPAAPLPELQRSVFGNQEPVPGSTSFVAPGLVELTGITPGQYSLLIHQPEDRPSRVLTLDASADQQIDSTAGALMADVSGTVQGAPEPAPGIPVLIGLSQPGKPNLQTINPDGTFAFEDLAPGSYEVVAMTSGHVLSVERITATNATVEGHRITLASEQHATLSVTLTEGSATVQGVAKQDGKPVAGAMIVLVPSDPDTSNASFRRDQTDSDGSFSLANVSSGSYTVVAIQDGWSLDWARSEVLASFLPKGEAVKVTAATGHVIKLPAPVEVQPREPAR